MSHDPFECLKHLEQERFRAMILHAAPEKSLSITQFAKKISERTGGKYLDLLDLFIHTEELSEHIDRFNPAELRKLLIEQSKGSSLLVVDKIDFILDTWRLKERNDFYQLIRTQWDGFKDGTKAILVFCLQTSLEIEALNIRDSQENSRVLSLSAFNDIL